MSQENVELARRMIEWFNAGETAAAQAHSTDDVEIVPLRAAMEGTTYRGPDAFAAFRTASEEAWEELQFEPEALRDGGERVVAIGQLSARGRGTGAEVSARVAMLFDFREGQVSQARSYSDVKDALDAAALTE
jgi:ketosteroid isomerase-like protein